MSNDFIPLEKRAFCREKLVYDFSQGKTATNKNKVKMIDSPK